MLYAIIIYFSAELSEYRYGGAASGKNQISSAARMKNIEFTNNHEKP